MGALAIVLGISAAAIPGLKSETWGIRHAVPQPEQRVDINLASLDELMKVPGMTRSWAGRIVRFRPYRSKQDLLDKGIVSGEVYNRIKDYIIAHRKDSGQ
jgi:DNA uptake protein ComE-like DNA-binding protein